MDWSQFSQVLAATPFCSDIELLRRTRDSILSIKEFTNLHRQMGGDDRSFDLCMPCLRYDFHKKNTLILAAGRKRDRFYFILEGFCGVFGLRDENSLQNEVKLVSQLQEQESQLRHWTAKLTVAESLEEELLLKQTLLQINQKVTSFTNCLNALKGKTDATKLKEAIVNEPEINPLEKAKLLAKHFTQRQCIYAKESELSSGDGLDEINVNYGGQLLKKTVITLKDSHMVSIAVEDYARVFSHTLGQLIHSQRMLRSYFYPPIPEETVQQLSYDFRSKYYERNEAIYHQASPNPNSFYLLLQGTVEIRKYQLPADERGATSVSVDVKTPQLAQDKRGVTEGYASLMILSGKQVIGAECVGRVNEYSAVSVSTETRVMVLDKKKFELFDHQFNFRKFFAEQAAVQRKFFAERLKELTAFEEQRKQLHSQQQASRRMISMIAERTRVNDEQRIDQQPTSEGEASVIRCSMQSYSNSIGDLLQQRFQAEDRLAQAGGGRQTDTGKKVKTKAQSNEGAKRFISVGFDFEQDAAKIRRKQILIGHKISKYFSTRGNHLSSIIKDQLLVNSTENGKESNKQSFLPSSTPQPQQQPQALHQSASQSFIAPTPSNKSIKRRGDSENLSRFKCDTKEDEGESSSVYQQESLRIIRALPVAQPNSNTEGDRSRMRRSKLAHSQKIQKREQTDAATQPPSAQQNTDPSTKDFSIQVQMHPASPNKLHSSVVGNRRYFTRHPSIQDNLEQSPIDSQVIDSFTHLSPPNNYNMLFPTKYEDCPDLLSPQAAAATVAAPEATAAAPAVSIQSRNTSVPRIFQSFSEKKSTSFLSKSLSTKFIDSSMNNSSTSSSRNSHNRQQQQQRPSETDSPAKSQRIITSFLRRGDNSATRQQQHHLSDRVGLNLVIDCQAASSIAPSSTLTSILTKKRNILTSTFSSSPGESGSPSLRSNSSELKSPSNKLLSKSMIKTEDRTSFTDRKSIFSPHSIILPPTSTSTSRSTFKDSLSSTSSALKSPLNNSSNPFSHKPSFAPFFKTRDFLVL